MHVLGKHFLSHSTFFSPRSETGFFSLTLGAPEIAEIVHALQKSIFSIWRTHFLMERVLEKYSWKNRGATIAPPLKNC